uniref:Uncharacterized protein n=1 Tax=Timema bartmani TaxID=61472 RepID=A0A7R9I304_9NEOP|nr:unnamed protein product [Timema bartmani]
MLVDVGMSRGDGRTPGLGSRHPKQQFGAITTLQYGSETWTRMQARMVEQMDISLTELVGEVLQEVEQTTLSPEHLYNSVEGNLKYKNRV